jgi:hypothetical protein
MARLWRNITNGDSLWLFVISREKALTTGLEIPRATRDLSPVVELSRKADA